MEIKKYFIIIILISIILFSGCSKKSDKGIPKIDVYKGKEGVSFEFIKDLPPSNLMSDEELQIGFKAVNKGAYDVKNGVIRVTGDPGYISFSGENSELTNIKNLEGKTNFNPIDSEEIYTFDIITTFADKGFNEHDSLILISACYDYNNILSTQICVDPDVYNLKATEKNCQITSKSFSGQGGPVGISRIEPSMYLKNNAIYPKFKITISNFGTGEVFTPGNSQTFCSSQNVNRDTINSIKIKKLEFRDITLADMNCVPTKDKIVFRNKQAEITCTLKDGSPKRISVDSDSYTTNLNIEIEYGYSISSSKTITVQNKEII